MKMLAALAVARRPVATAGAAGLAALCLAACGSAVNHHTVPAQRAAATPSTPAPPPAGVPVPGPTNVPAPAGAVAVIRGWADALRRGDVTAAAHYFALPSVLVNGTDPSGRALVIHIFSLGDALAANASLSCGAQLLSTDVRGRYVNALFRLTDRTGPGGGCGSGLGQTARTNFVISGGRIVQWLRAPADPGDGGNGGTPSSGPVAAV